MIFPVIEGVDINRGSLYRSYTRLSKLGFGKLPGDIMVERNGMSLYFPITSSIVISIIISIVLLILRK